MTLLQELVQTQKGQPAFSKALVFESMPDGVKVDESTYTIDSQDVVKLCRTVVLKVLHNIELGAHAPTDED